MSDSRERTAEQREAARRERELRRTGRAGEAPRPAESPDQEPVSRPAENPDPAPAPRPAESPQPAPPPAAPVPTPGAFEDDGAASGDDHVAVEKPLGIRRVHRTRSGPSPIPAPATRGVARRSWQRSRGDGGHSRAGRIVAALALVLAGVLAWFVIELFQPFHGSGSGTVTVTIPAHTSSRNVGDLLAREGVVSSGLFFELRALLAGEGGNLRAGTYHLLRDMSYGSALSVLTTPPPAAKVTNLTISEGDRRQTIAALLRKQGIRGDYNALTRRSPLLDPRRYGVPRGTNTLEGFLFPSTYQLREPISVAALVADQLTAFRQQFGTVNLGYARSQHLTPYEVLIIASMVEGEAQKARDRPLVASVIYNRLRDGMLLQIDPTVRYATGNYTRPITLSQLHSSSAYNTYVHKGLPPTPIDNPGLAAIQAAAHPAITNYLFFVVKPCGNGEQVFTSTYAQFLADQTRYQAARAQRGGRSPANC